MEDSISGTERLPRTLLYAPNWLGDAVMAFPAVQAWRHLHPDTRLTVLTKPGLAPLWRMHDDAHDVIEIPSGFRGTLSCARALRPRHFEQALILPNSFRSAFIPWGAGIDRRRGFARHARRWLLTDPVRIRHESTPIHQSLEYAAILLGTQTLDMTLPAPALALSPRLLQQTCQHFAIPPQSLLIGVIPGAARGPSKRWPHFGPTAARLASDVEQSRFVVFGTPAEADLCAQVARTIGPAAYCVAGQTSLPQFAALLAACRLVLCNDSGGMHLAAAVGTPVVAVFGLTDPARTGPPAGHYLIRNPAVRGTRAIARNDRSARDVLHAIRPECVLAAARKALAKRRDAAGNDEED